jgi:hypothetical protein
VGKNKVACWSCGLTWEFSPPLGRGDSCSGCRRDAKVCLNCKFYDRHANRECLESQAELVKDKEKSNFCDWFESKSLAQVGGNSREGNPLDQLFGQSGQPKEKSKFEDELEAFFKKK